MKRLVMGCLFIGLAVLVLLKDSLGLHQEMPFWTTVWFVLSAVTGVHRLVKLDWIASLFCFGLAFIAANSVYDWVNFGTWTMVISLGLFCLGLSLMFKSKSKFKSKRLKEVVRGEQFWEKETSFGSSTRYIHDDNFLHDSVEVVFGSSTVYFDQAVILGDKASFRVEGVFSSVTLYLPTNWQAVVEAEQVFSTIMRQLEEKKFFMSQAI